MVAHFYLGTWPGLVLAAALLAFGVALHLINGLDEPPGLRPAGPSPRASSCWPTRGSRSRSSSGWRWRSIASGRSCRARFFPTCTPTFTWRSSALWRPWSSASPRACIRCSCSHPSPAAGRPGPALGTALGVPAVVLGLALGCPRRRGRRRRGRRRRRRPSRLGREDGVESEAPRLDWGLRFVAHGTAFLVPARGPRPRMAFDLVSGPRAALAYAVVVLGGWISLTIVGMMLKIVPFLVWYRVYSSAGGPRCRCQRCAAVLAARREAGLRAPDRRLHRARGSGGGRGVPARFAPRASSCRSARSPSAQRLARVLCHLFPRASTETGHRSANRSSAVHRARELMSGASSPPPVVTSSKSRRACAVCSTPSSACRWWTSASSTTSTSSTGRSRSP